ncbi:hypothetical protein [Aquibacillus kalidii]|uniref:hypothetical protein n=1 Tax=Aquibacillus kalidii TaxID=2762597 RepID=UPI00164623AB|nr:hypothetical protein [Aquibacillus kalidii]
MKKNRWKEEQLHLLREVAEDRLKPTGISIGLLGCFGVSVFIFSILKFATGYSVYINHSMWPYVMKTFFVLLLFQGIITLAFLNEKVAYKHQKFQMLFCCLILIITSIEMYFFYFSAWDDKDAPEYLFTVGIYALVSGFILMMIFFIRGIKRVNSGELAKGGTGLYNFKDSKGSVSIPIIFIATLLGAVISKTLNKFDGDTSIMIGIYLALFLAIVIQYSLAIALTEFLLLAFCKIRYDSFHVALPKKRRRRKKDGVPK